MGLSVKKAFKKVAGSKISSAVSKVVNTKNLAIAMPAASVFTSGGRAALMNTYGGVAKGLVGAYTGGAGGGAADVFSGLAQEYLGGGQEPAADPASNSAQVFSEGGSEPLGGASRPRPFQMGAGMPPWLLVTAAAGAALLVVLILKKK